MTFSLGEVRMRKSEQAEAWVVYQMTLHGKQTTALAVCEQAEWDEMELAQPGYHKLVRSGITNEGEAERLARGNAGDPAVRSVRSR
jgi:hypothetical protein